MVFERIFFHSGSGGNGGYSGAGGNHSLLTSIFLCKLHELNMNWLETGTSGNGEPGEAYSQSSFGNFQQVLTEFFSF